MDSLTLEKLSYLTNLLQKHQIIDAKQVQRDIEVYAFIRFASEEITFAESLKSIASVIKRGVLVYHKSPQAYGDNSSLEIAKKFCEDNPGFKLYEYPHIVYGVSRDKFPKDAKPENYLAPYYNFALNKLKELAKADFKRENRPNTQAYFIKIDGDHIYDPLALQNHIDLLLHSPLRLDVICFPKVNMIYLYDQQQGLQDLYLEEVIQHEDHFIVNTDDVNFYTALDKKFCYEKICFNPKLYPPLPPLRNYVGGGGKSLLWED